MVPPTDHSVDLSPDRRKFYELLHQIDDVQREATDDVESALYGINVVTVAEVPGAHSAGLSLVDSERRVTTLAPTDDWASMLDEIQNEHREGPSRPA
ncbi:hypothetical protein FK535_10005 [Mycolicibacterium sp. 018/SC-01/001]|uniref:hypothetical protein n=1 Tax=Mycolicibacterium sp. 018/SC-01/001 TaxID=2592069 RepID=UPI00118173D1|nr:hypothetical protein [Mycolicibacterium sp. 018/SC-01/001]TRW84813.1 hypothetical protein FK535_10005 [Mycolicibacterium sp. 018/SC-01/001]